MNLLNLFKRKKEIVSIESIKIYTTEYCILCKFLRETLQKKGIAFEEIEINKVENKEELVKELNIDGLPLIFINGNRIEGLDKKELVKYGITFNLPKRNLFGDRNYHIKKKLD